MAAQEFPDETDSSPDKDRILIRMLSSLEDYDQAVDLQDETWGAGFSDRVPAAILRVGQKVGGVSAGAFDTNGTLVGFVFGLTGVRDGKLVHWSDMLAVRERARGHRLGERLKIFQRDVVRALGVEKMLWTFDPLVARNAHFNLNRLHAGIAEYAPNFYGANTGSPLHGNLPTDRCVAEWIFAPTANAAPRDATMNRSDAPFVTTLADNLGVRNVESFVDAPRVHVPIPSDIEPILKTNQKTALAWRLATRAAMMHYLARGYRVSAFLRGANGGLPAYELTPSSTGHA
jgi:predicted GNAT superfamily acetyltransferase